MFERIFFKAKINYKCLNSNPDLTALKQRTAQTKTTSSRDDVFAFNPSSDVERTSLSIKVTRETLDKPLFLQRSSACWTDAC